MQCYGSLLLGSHIAQVARERGRGNSTRSQGGGDDGGRNLCRQRVHNPHPRGSGRPAILHGDRVIDRIAKRDARRSRFADGKVSASRHHSADVICVIGGRPVRLVRNDGGRVHVLAGCRLPRIGLDHDGEIAERSRSEGIYCAHDHAAVRFALGVGEGRVERGACRKGVGHHNVCGVQATAIGHLKRVEQFLASIYLGRPPLSHRHIRVVRGGVHGDQSNGSG